MTKGTGPAVPSDVQAWLAALARALQRHGLYPPGHPALGDLTGELHEALDPLLEERDELVFAVAPDRLLFEEAWTGTSSQIPGLARRLHEHDLSAFGVEAGASASELGALLTALRERPASDEDRLGRRAGMASRWPHVWIEPRHYDRLALEEELSDEPIEDRDRRAARLWLGLARSARALPDELADLSLEGLDTDELVETAYRVPPDAVAEAIRALRETEGMEEIGGALLQIARELEHPEGGFDLRERFTGLLQALTGPDVRRLLERGMRSPERQELLQSTTSWLPPDTLMQMVETTADLGDIDVSHWMLRILVKLSAHSRVEAALSTGEADQALRDQVRRALTGWGEDPHQDDGSYGDTLRAMSEVGDLAGLPLVDTDHAPEALRVLQMGIEVDRLGSPGEQAFAALRRSGRVGEILEAVQEADPDSAVATELWDRLARAEVVAELAAKDPPDFEALGRLGPRMPRLVAETLLDLLSDSRDRSVRSKAFSILTSLGPGVASSVMARLEDERWFVKRNVLALLYEIGPPDGFSARPLATHENEQVRREAYKHLLRDPSTRAEAVSMCLRESDPRTLTLGLAALESGDRLEPELVPVLARHAEDSALPGEVQVAAARALSLSEAESARRALLHLCLRRHPILFWRRRLRPENPVVREAVGGLARRWPDDAAVHRVLRHPEASAWIESATGRAG